MKRHINSALILAVALVAAPALAANNKLNEVDQDNNGSISKVEFERHVGERFFNQADRNGDGMIDDTEFTGHRMGGNLSEFDRDSDGRLTRAEWQDSLFEKFDKNRDMVLDKDEWKQVKNAGIGR